jgi:hypothetical protein
MIILKVLGSNREFEGSAAFRNMGYAVTVFRGEGMSGPVQELSPVAEMI